MSSDNTPIFHWGLAGLIEDVYMNPIMASRLARATCKKCWGKGLAKYNDPSTNVSWHQLCHCVEKRLERPNISWNKDKGRWEKDCA